MLRSSTIDSPFNAQLRLAVRFNMLGLSTGACDEPSDPQPLFRPVRRSSSNPIVPAKGREEHAANDGEHQDVRRAHRVTSAARGSREVSPAGGFH